MFSSAVLDSLSVRRRNWHAAQWRVLQRRQKSVHTEEACKKRNPEVTKEKNSKPKDINELEVKVELLTNELSSFIEAVTESFKTVAEFDGFVNEMSEFKKTMTEKKDAEVSALGAQIQALTAAVVPFMGKLDNSFENLNDDLATLKSEMDVVFGSFENFDIMRTYMKDLEDRCDEVAATKVERFEFDEDLNFLECKVKGIDSDLKNLQAYLHPGHDSDDSTDEQLEASTTSYKKRRFMG